MIENKSNNSESFIAFKLMFYEEKSFNKFQILINLNFKYKLRVFFNFHIFIKTDNLKILNPQYFS